MASIALGGQTKSFYRLITGTNQFAPDSTTKGNVITISPTTGQDVPFTQNGNNAGLAAMLAAVVQASGDGFIIPPGQEFMVRFPNALTSVFVIQKWNPYISVPAWETVYTFSNPAIGQVYKFCYNQPCRIGIPTGGTYSAEANLALEIEFNQSDRQGVV